MWVDLNVSCFPFRCLSFQILGFAANESIWSGSLWRHSHIQSYEGMDSSHQSWVKDTQTKLFSNMLSCATVCKKQYKRVAISLTCLCFVCVSQGRLKSIHENMPKSVIEPTPKFDCHVSKNATRVTSLLSYRAFELTQVNSGPISAGYRAENLGAWDTLCLFRLGMNDLVYLSSSLAAILLWVCVWWDQASAQACVSLRRSVLSVQREGGCSGPYDIP